MQVVKESKLHPIIQQLFKERNLSSTQVEELLSWNLNKLPDLTLINDIKKASQRIIQAISNNEPIAIYGDYDVDGTTSCALLYHFFKMVSCEVYLFQPSRFIEGYGLHPSSIDHAVEKNIKVLVTVDCGITNNAAAEYAIEKGIDLIITDHHTDVSEEMPQALAIINPNRRDEEKNSPLKFLAGVGVAFALCLQIKKELEMQGKRISSIYPLLQFVAIGTLCDLVPLTTMNLKLVRHGLGQIKNTQYPGLMTFFSPEERKNGFIPSEKLFFNVGPLINSKGRLDKAEKALELLITDDSGRAYEYYNHLEICNRERKLIQEEVFVQAKEMIINQISGHDHIISIAYHSSWHEGVIGIVASKLVETFKVPAIVITDSGKGSGEVKASVRSTDHLDIFACLKQTSDLFVKFGGHKAAAGFSMSKENLDHFKIRIKNILAQIPPMQRVQQDYFDIDIDPKEITPQLLRQLELLEPFGNGNPRPTFRIKKIRLDSYEILKDVHVRWSFSSYPDPSIKLKGISFNYVGSWGVTHPADLYKAQNLQNEDISILFNLAINRWNGNEYIQLQINKITTNDF